MGSKDSVAGGWTQFRGRETRSAVAAGGASEPPERYSSFEIGRRALSAEPVVADTAEGTMVYVAGSDGIHAVEGGSERFHFETSQSVRAAPAVADVDGVTVVAGTLDDTVHAIDGRTGDEQWTAEVDGVQSSPVVADGTVYVGSSDNSLYALDAETGEVEWSVETGDGIRSAPAVHNGHVFVGSRDEHLYAFDADSGEQLWAVQPEVADLGRIESAPAATESLVYVAENGELCALDVETGREMWVSRLHGKRTAALAVGDEAVYAGCSDGFLYALEAETGEWQWTLEADGRTTMGDPTLCDGTVIAGDSNGTLYAVDTESGDEEWQMELEEGKLSAGPAIYDGMYYIGSEGRRNGLLITLAGADADTGGVEFGSNETLDAPTVDAQHDGADWRVMSGNPGRTGHRNGSAATDAVMPSWSMSRRGRSSDLTVDDDRIYAYESEGDYLCAYSLEDGSEVWTADEVLSYSTTPIVADGVVYAGSQRENALFSFDAETGETRWRWDHGSRGRITEPVAAGNHVIVGVGDTLSLLSAETGEPEWETGIGDEGVGSPLLAYGTVYITADEKLQAIDPGNGVERFSVALDRNATAPAVGDGQVFVGADNRVIAVDAETGDENWEASISGEPRTPAVRDGVVYASTGDGVLAALDAEDGEQHWDFEAGRRLSPPAADGDSVVVVSADPGVRGDDEHVYTLDAETGEERHFYELEDVASPGRPIIADDTILLSPDGRTTLSLESRGGSTDATEVETDSWNARGSNLGASNYAGGGPAADDAEIRWEADLGRRANESAIVENGVVYVPTDNKEVAAYDAESGDQLWATDSGRSINGTPAIHEGTVYIATGGGELRALNAETGENLWAYDDTEGSFSGFLNTPAVSPDGEMAFVGCDDERLYAVDTESAERRWAFSASAGSRSEEEVEAAPIVAGDAVYSASTYSVFGLDAETGTKLWSIEQHTPEGVAFGDEKVFVGAQRRLFAMDADRGDEEWEVDMSGTVSAPAFVDGTVYACCGEAVHAVDAASGNREWSCNIGGQNDIAPAVAEGVVYAGGTDGVLHAIEDSDVLWSVELGDSAQLSGAPVVADGTVYVVDSQNGTLLAIS